MEKILARIEEGTRRKKKREKNVAKKKSSMQNAPRCLKLDECVLAAVFNFGFKVGVGQFDAACRGVGLRVIGTASKAMWFLG